MKFLGNKNEYQDDPLPTTTLVDEAIFNKIQSGEISPDRPFNHYIISYNKDINAIFITIYYADGKQEIYTGKKEYSDYNSDGLRKGTKDNIQWSIYDPHLNFSFRSSLNYSRANQYKIAINGDIFQFIGTDNNFEMKIKDEINEYKKVVNHIAQTIN